MSNNPFESPQENPISATAVSPGAPAPRTAAMPGAVTAISIICLILGIMGLCGVCFQGLALGFQSSLMEFAESMPQPPAQKEFNRLNLEAQKPMIIPGLILMVINLFVASLLVIGSIGCLKRKSGGRNMLRLGLLAAIFYSILNLVRQIAGYFVAMGNIRKGVADYQGEVPVESLETMVEAGNIGAIIGGAIAGLFILALVVFYFWARSYLGKEKLDRFFTN